YDNRSTERNRRLRDCCPALELCNKALDTENSIVREGDGFEYRVCLNTLKVTLLNGAITTADNSALCYLQRVPMKGYVIKEMCMFDNEPSSAKAAHGQLFRNLRELVTLTGMMFH
ncbi:hypothetical protein, partial [Aeromonas sp. QDB56]|uniref:hypothetical protein n=1 Tax=Aeromonas sp. QDB56 TaxID=2990495 RepID=UPI0022E1BA9B